MLEWMLFRIIMVAFFILASSFFVAAEFALVSVRETRIQQLIALGRPGARTALKLKHSIDEFLPAVQLGVTVAGLALGWIGEPAIADIILNFLAGSLHRLPAHAVLYAHTIAVIFAFSLITYFEVLLGELVPKSLALQRAQALPCPVTRRRRSPFSGGIETHRHRHPPHGVTTRLSGRDHPPRHRAQPRHRP